MSFDAMFLPRFAMSVVVVNEGLQSVKCIRKSCITCLTRLKFFPERLQMLCLIFGEQIEYALSCLELTFMLTLT